MDHRLTRALAALASDESGPGTRVSDAPLRMALLYPSPYRAAMSSLGFLEIHRRANARPGTSCERAVLPDPDALERYRESRTPLMTIESQRFVHDFDLIGVSFSYELELTGLVTALELAGLSPLAADRTENDPLIVIGGPITFSNPLPLAPFADVMVLGEGEEALEALLSRLEARPEAARGSRRAREALLEELAGLPGFLIPRFGVEVLPPIAQVEDEVLPAASEIRTPHTELANMVLVEPERGCHRGCTFCVMRRSTNGGMRLVPPERVLARVPEDAERVGLVGAAVTDHPQLKTILRGLIEDRGLRVGISSLRADRLDDELVGLLAQGGYRSMTVALDAASARLRDSIEKNLKDRACERAVDLAKAHGMRHLKLYVIVGLPGEDEGDLEELLEFSGRLAKVLPVKLSMNPFVPKFHTPLADAPFIGERRAHQVLRHLRKQAPRGVEITGPSAKEAYVEYRLAQGGPEHGARAIAVAKAGGGLGAWKRALADLPERSAPSNFSQLIPAPTLRRRQPVAPSAAVARPHAALPPLIG